MSQRTQQSKSTALQFCKYMNEGQLDLVADLFTPDGKWQVMANGPSPPWPGTRPASEACVTTGHTIRSFEEWKFTVIAVVAEEDLVAVEATSHGRGPGSHAYDNNYMLKFEFEGDKIKMLKEYMDVFAVQAWVKTQNREAKA